MGCFVTKETPASEQDVNKTAPPSTSSPQQVDVRPTWTQEIVSSGADKDILRGEYKGCDVAICVAKSRGGGHRRIQNEIETFKALGDHPNIIKMYSSGFDRGVVFMVLEVVEPIGFDLDRLKNMYSFAGQTVPSSLMARIFRDLISALTHMHKRRIIHRDLKTENVLVDTSHNAKLIDMGIACEVGKKDLLRAAYLAPELCTGKRALGIEVDAWGLGLILHQIYQNQWKVLADSGPVRMLDGKPSEARPMEKPVRDAMCGLLRLVPSSRWTLQRLQDSEWLRGTGEEVSQHWHQPVSSKESSRHHLRRYVSSKPLPTALAIYITVTNHKHIIGKAIHELGLSSIHGVTVLLVNSGRSFETLPGANTLIEANSWLYLGVPQSEELMDKAIAGLDSVFNGKPTSSRSSSSGGRFKSFRALTEQEVIETGKLVEFTIDFDCFSFPAHIGNEAIVGTHQDGKKENLCRALNLRRIFRVNLVGIQRMGETEPEWFPGASAFVRPDDLGLVVREPCSDGSTRPTLRDADLKALMDKDRFHELLKPQS